jgi:hypothetical protein
MEIYLLLSYFSSKIPWCEVGWGQDVFDEQKYDYRYLRKAAYLELRSQGYGDISEQDQIIMEIFVFFQPTTHTDLYQSWRILY